MLKGIDTSHWNDGLDVAGADVDFCLFKVSQGTNFVDYLHQSTHDACVASGKLWGFYHFANGDSPESEAEFFFNTARAYVGNGIPVLDYEIQLDNGVEWCERFLNHWHDLAGNWPLLYISASLCPMFTGSWIPSKCDLWIAGYPQPYTYWVDRKMPYNQSPWPYVAIWQFTSSLQMQGQNVDANWAYMTREAWGKYAAANVQPTPAPTPSADYLTAFANDVIAGLYGNGDERKERVYRAVQDKVNEILGV